MSSYRVFCVECGADCSIEFIDTDAEPKFCPHCAAELDESDVGEEFDEEAEWDKLTEDSLDDLDDWKS